MQDTVDKELETMLRMWIIEPSTSAYASPVVIVRKPDGTNRVCVDYRKLNKITVFDPEPMLQPEQIFAMLEKDRYFSTYDVTEGYWQVPMNVNDKAFTAFVTQRGLHQFKVMLFGLVNASATLNRLMHKLLFRSDSLDNYVDDVLAHTLTWENHLQAIRDFLSKFRMHIWLCDLVNVLLVRHLCHTLVIEWAIASWNQSQKWLTKFSKPQTSGQEAVEIIFGIDWILQKIHPKFCCFGGTTHRFD